MLKRKNASPYFICSVLIHLVLLLVVWWMVPQQVPLLPFREEIVALITHVERPPLPVKIIPVAEPAPPVVVKETKPPPPPKPKAGLNSAWQTENQSETDIPKSEIRQQEGPNRSRGSIGDGLLQGNAIVSNPTNHTAENRVAVNTPNQTIIAPRTSEADYVEPQGEMKPIALGANDALNDGSPTVNAPKIHYGSRRGDALRATGMGNSWGGGGTSSGAIGGVFVHMMKDIARTLVDASTRKKVDVVFVLDETGSMWDNIRGIRAYVDFLFDAFEREGRDATFGLVTFTDEAKKIGRTDDLGTFKNWLFQIGVDGGGETTEAGLDALMTAATETKFRKGAERFIILASDAAFHDADYDGRSVYSLDQVIETLQNEQIRVDVIGIDYLPIQQIGLATGGTWRPIPGRRNEFVPPLTLTVKLFSKLGTLNLESERIDDKITIYINNPPRPKQLSVTWKVLNPLGERVYGPFTEKKIIPDDGSTKIELTPTIDTLLFQTMAGVYTVIYRLENEHGHQSILRRTLTY